MNATPVLTRPHTSTTEDLAQAYESLSLEGLLPDEKIGPGARLTRQWEAPGAGSGKSLWLNLQCL